MQNDPQIKLSPSDNASSSKQETILWEAFEYSFQKKSPDWFWALGIITISLSIVALLYNNVLFAIFIILGGGTLVLRVIKKPCPVIFKINENGVVINKDLYPYKTLESFWITHEDPEPKILIKSKKMLLPYLIIPVGDADQDEIQNYLGKHLLEEEHIEPFAHKIMEYLGF